MAITLDLTPQCLLQVCLTIKPDGSITGEGGVAPDEGDLAFDEIDIAFDEV